MHVTNIHKATIPSSKEKVGALLETLASKNDQLWPHENWPKMYLKDGLKIGSKGGHTPIKYEIVEFTPQEFIRFKFIAPKGFNGYHQFEIRPIDEISSEIVHTIQMDVMGKGVFTWFFAVLHLHNALLRDLLAKVEASFGVTPKVRSWNIWVKILRWIFSGGKSAKQKIPNTNTQLDDKGNATS